MFPVNTKLFSTMELLTMRLRSYPLQFVAVNPFISMDFVEKDLSKI